MGSPSMVSGCWNGRLESDCGSVDGGSISELILGCVVSATLDALAAGMGSGFVNLISEALDYWH